MKKEGKLRPWAVFFWIILWQILGMAFNQSLLLPSPTRVFTTLIGLMMTSGFWKAICFSGGRILFGVVLGTFFGSLLAAFSYRFRFVKELLAPIVYLIKAVPVASFIILALVWIKAKNLTVFIVFLMIFPLIYQNLLTGFLSVDKKLLEMARIFRVEGWRKILGIYLPGVLPYFRTAMSLGLGLSFKAGSAAEVIAIPSGSLGEMLYKSKVYFLTPELFAVTLTIVIMSIIFEKSLLALLKLVIKRVGIDD